MALGNWILLERVVLSTYIQLLNFPSPSVVRWFAYFTELGLRFWLVSRLIGKRVIMRYQPPDYDMQHRHNGHDLLMGLV